ncbi:MAG: RNA polymerase sigma factor [Candidatus Krumholzibacteriia bacterium]
MQENDKDVIERWCNGDRSAFETLVRRHMGDAYLTALGFTGNPEDARDLSQDAFVKAFQARKSFDPKRPFYPWFYRILKNHCLNFVQRVRKRTESLYHGDHEAERFAASGPTPLERMEKQERIDLMRRAIDRLSFEHREVIVLKNFRGLSYREMADLLDTPIGTIMSRLYYARKALKEIILEWERDGAERTTGATPEGSAAPGEVV